MIKKILSRNYLVFLLLLAICVITNETTADTVQYAYDDAGRLIEADYGDKTITYKYDKAGNLLERKITDSAADTSPVPDIKANGTSGTLNINKGEQLSIAVSLNPGNYTGTSADWYIAVDTPSGWQSFNMSQMDYSTSGISVLLQGYGLFSLGSTAIFSTSSLSVGTYTYYFAVILSEQLYYDSVAVNVQ